MHQATVIIVVAVMVEAVVETLKLQGEKMSWDRVTAIAIGLILAVGANIDIFVLLGVPLKFSLMGNIITGLIISRGANFAHDILQIAYNIMKNSKV